MSGYAIIRSRRKTLALTVDRQGRVTVRAPARASDAAIAAFVQSKAGWLEKTLAKVQADAAQYGDVSLAVGGVVPYRGIRRRIARADVDAVTLQEDAILLPHAAPPGALRAFLRQEARRVALSRVACFSARMGVVPGPVRISNARTRWGSCGAGNSINLCWRLIFFPPEAMDYIIVHELCHIRERSHGPAFWAAVRAVLPDYKTQQDWIKQNQSLMDVN